MQEEHKKQQELVNETNDNDTHIADNNRDQSISDLRESQDVQEQTALGGSVSPSPKESWHQARERLKQQEEENKLLREQTRFLMQQLNNQLPKQQDKPSFDVESLPEDDIATTQHIKETSRQYQARMNQLEERQIMLDMREKYPDFKKVCSPDNLNRLGQEDPVFAETVLLNRDKEKQWDMVYKAVKRSDFYKPATPPTSVTEEDEQAQINAVRPKPLSAAKTSQSKSALGNARVFSRQMSDEEKSEIYKRALAIASGQSNSM